MVGKVDRANFFPIVRRSLFGGFLTQSQVDGLNDFLDEHDLYYPSGDDPRNLAYRLATTFWETGETMLPVEERGKGRGLAYGVTVNGQVYYGRGYVQLTWEKNYEAMSPIVGVDLVANPDQALLPSIAAKILFHGMDSGTFTGHKLSDYITAARTDYRNCRRIINGTDKAVKIAGYATSFQVAIGSLT